MGPVEAWQNVNEYQDTQPHLRVVLLWSATGGLDSRMKGGLPCSHLAELLTLVCTDLLLLQVESNETHLSLESLDKLLLPWHPHSFPALLVTLLSVTKAMSEGFLFFLECCSCASEDVASEQLEPCCSPELGSMIHK